MCYIKEDTMRYMLNGREVSRNEFFAEKKGIKGILKTGRMPCQGTGWPMYSDALGCNANEIEAQTKELHKHGLHADFDKEGRMKLESRGHRKQMCEFFGLKDLNGGYSDAT